MIDWPSFWLGVVCAFAGSAVVGLALGRTLFRKGQGAARRGEARRG